jgi:hypothetical protein
LRSSQGHESRDGSPALGDEDFLASFGGIEITAELSLEACNANACHMTMMVTFGMAVNFRGALDGERAGR